MEKTDLKSQDRLRLQQAFYRGFDHERFASLGRSPNDLRGQPNVCCIGSGSHFRSWQVRTDHGKYVVSIAHSDAETSLTGVAQRRLAACLKKLKLNPLNLIPPFEYWLTDDRLAIVTPMGVSGTNSVARHWLPIDTEVAQLDKGLKTLGLTIDDIIQIANYDGIPFIHDLSDLTFWQPGY